jgi:hypothetical protein
VVGIVATAAAGFALLVCVFIRSALRNARQDALTAEKLAAIKRSVFSS